MAHHEEQKREEQAQHRVEPELLDGALVQRRGEPELLDEDQMQGHEEYLHEEQPVRVAQDDVE